MREAAHALGDDHPADLNACHELYVAADRMLAGAPLHGPARAQQVRVDVRAAWPHLADPVAQGP